MTLYVSLIVEGHSEARGAVERLLHRIWSELFVSPMPLRVLPPSRCKRDSFLNPQHPEFVSKIEEAMLKLGQQLRRDPSGRGVLFVLLDAEADCPATLGPALLAAAKGVRSDADIACVLAKQMFENWIVAGASALASVNELPESLPPRPTPENGSGASWLDHQLRQRNKGRKYKKTVDAEVFVRAMDLHECRDNSRSFRKLLKELETRVPPPPQADPETEGAAE
ncbi:DUF4276 family protein [Gemmata sp. JC717]|uniref:DUF4276 family protein n=1 Tax=Gemmata algarum TaxID=2975278 RepID=UPI0021BB6EA6|nr:DUF4276 family protein [Gemmata algarum]MDY3556108.1 DUF4276 family protein [Gemmata algarum]